MFGISEKDFWDQTPRQTQRQIEAAKLRHDREWSTKAVHTAAIVNSSIKFEKKKDMVDPEDLYVTLSDRDLPTVDEDDGKSKEEHREEFEEMKEMMLDDAPDPDPQTGDD